MTPRHIIICSFLLGCAIIGAGAVIGPKRDMKRDADASIAATTSVAPEPMQRDLTQDVPLQSATPQPSPVQQPAAQPAPTEPRPTQAQIPAATESPVDTSSVPIMSTYESKKLQETKRVMARDPKAFWIRQIVTKIEEKKAELPSSIKDPATVLLEFAIGRDGTLLSKSVSKSSGSDEVDKIAIAMLERAQPFPPMPEGLTDQELTFNLPVRFH